MIFSNTAVCSLSPLLVVAMATSTPSGVGGATTMNRKLSKNSLSSTAPPITKCPNATLYYPLAINNTIGSPHIVQRFPAATPAGSEKICDNNDNPDDVVCIGDTYTEFNTLYADQELTQPVATVASTSKVVNIQTIDGNFIVNEVTGSIHYDDIYSSLTYGGRVLGEEDDQTTGMDFSVSGGTQDCVGIGGHIFFLVDRGVGYFEPYLL